MVLLFEVQQRKGCLMAEEKTDVRGWPAWKLLSEAKRNRVAAALLVKAAGEYERMARELAAQVRDQRKDANYE